MRLRLLPTAWRRNISRSPLPIRTGSPLAGIELQRSLESNAYVLGGSNYRAPGQLVGDFIAGKPSAQFALFVCRLDRGGAGDVEFLDHKVRCDQHGAAHTRIPHAARVDRSDGSAIGMADQHRVADSGRIQHLRQYAQRLDQLLEQGIAGAQSSPLRTAASFPAAAACRRWRRTCGAGFPRWPC